jgi:FKBP-type peptidyl-prolyl cis-trans isomerase
MKQLFFLLALCSLAGNLLAQTKTFHRKTESARVAIGEVALIYLRQQMIHEGDTVDGKEMPNAVPVQVTEAQDIVMEGIMEMGEGDSLTIACTAEEFFGKDATGNMPPNAILVFHIGISKVMTTGAYQVYYQEQAELAKTAEDRGIQAYLAQQGLEAKRTQSGLYYAITKMGEGERANLGDNLEVHYTGYLLDGTKFDSSVDRGPTFQFPVGMGRVIAGWDEAFLLLPEGSEAIIVLPAQLAYGSRGAGAIIKPNSVLRFDVSFVKNNGQ